MMICMTGGRKYKNKDLVFRIIEALSYPDPYNASFVVGDCPTGLDQMVVDILGTDDVKVYEANWEKHGKAAGPIRNGEMLKKEWPDLVIAFPGGKGTEDCVRQAKALDIPVLRVED